MMLLLYILYRICIYEDKFYHISSKPNLIGSLDRACETF